MPTKKKTAPKKSKPVRSPLHLGAAVFIRGVTHYYTGRVVGLTANEVLLADAAWIADTGRFAQAMRDGTLSEVEPYPDGAIVSINRGAIMDASPWVVAMPRVQK